jgi:hypothetical protein
VLKDLVTLGLVYMRKLNSRRCAAGPPLRPAHLRSPRTARRRLPAAAPWHPQSRPPPEAPGAPRAQLQSRPRRAAAAPQVLHDAAGGAAPVGRRARDAGGPAGGARRLPCLRTPPNAPAWWLVRLRPLPPTPERRLSSSEARRGLRSSLQPAPKIIPTVHRQAGGRGFLVLETNFRLYAYTESRLWAEVIGEFTEVLYALPNLLVAQITRESVLRAVDNGVEPQEVRPPLDPPPISASHRIRPSPPRGQVIDFLERNAHPLMAAQTPVLPETVVEQVRLWAKERDRIRDAPARLYEHFASVAVFDKAEQYARDNGVHLWSKRDAARPAACQLVVVADAHERMKSFLRSLRPAAS